MAEAIHVAIGSEPDQRLPALLLERSIRQRASREVVIWWSWDPHTRTWHPMAERHERLGGTNFSAWRWLAPAAVRYGFLLGPGDEPERLIYLDCDQLVFADLAELEASLPDGKLIACVVGAEGNFNGKTPEPDARETSVMVIRHGKAPLAWDYTILAERVRDHGLISWVSASIPEARKAKSDYAALMQATWIPAADVHAIAPAWNHMNHYEPARTKLVHFTHVRSQPWKSPGHPLSKLWAEHLREAVAAREVSVALVEEEVAAGHVDPYWLAVAREGARAT